MQECNPTEEYPAGGSSVPMSAGGGRNAAPGISVHIGWIDFPCLKKLLFVAGRAPGWHDEPWSRFQWGSSWPFSGIHLGASIRTVNRLFGVCRVVSDKDEAALLST